MKRIFQRCLLYLVLLVIGATPCRAEELVLVSPHWDGFRREFEWGFLAWIKDQPGYAQLKVSIRWLDLGGASDIAKTMIARSAAGAPLAIDVIFGGGIDAFESMRRKGLLRSYQPQRIMNHVIPSDIHGNPLFDPDGYWFGVNVTSFGIAMNRELLKRQQVPEPEYFADLAKPFYQDLIGSADPRKSGSVRFIYELILQRYGWEEGWHLLYQIGSNIRSFSNNSSQSPKDLSTGEIALAPLIDSYGLDVEARYGSDRIRFVVPKDLESYFADPVALGAHGQHPRLAELFIEFCLSEAGQFLLIKQVGSKAGPRQYAVSRLPVLPSIYNSLTPEERTRREKPFDTSSAAFRYDPRLAQSRWVVVTKLLGAILVDEKELLRHARYGMGKDLSSVPVPVSLSNLEKLVKLQQRSDVEAQFELERAVLKIRSAFNP